ncbi:DUF1275 family protein [Streptomyces sp. I5]|uniref:DUF1275 family protein n=1 Tax=Streptomyces sp. I5 TaxID=2759947 RepID=UPI0027DB158F|nr:DUF1275 family protein [Streptomyces sp. I5]
MTVLTVIAGAVDAVSFLTLGKVFCALVTGNVLFAPAGEGDVPVARAAAASPGSRRAPRPARRPSPGSPRGDAPTVREATPHGTHPAHLPA